jgi:hypothetical protein
MGLLLSKDSETHSHSKTSKESTRGVVALAPQKPFVLWFIKPFCITTVKTAVGTQSGRNLLEELRDEAA